MASTRTAALVRARVGAARRSWWVAVALECAALGASALLVALAAAAWEGASPTDAGALAAGLLAGVGAAGGWWSDRRRTPAALAARLDRKLGRAGAFATAFECACAEKPGALAELLIAREGAAVDARTARRAVLPHTAALLGAPVLAAALLAAVVELAERPAVLERATGYAAVPPAGAVAAARERETDAVAARLRALAAAPAGAAMPDLTAAGELAGLDDALRRLAARAGDGETARRVRDLRAELERLRRAGRDAQRATARAGDSDRGVPAAGGERTMSDRAAGPGLPGAPTAAEPPVAAGDRAGPDEDRSAGSHRWWPRRHDAVVERWLAARRAALRGADATLPEDPPQ